MPPVCPNGGQKVDIWQGWGVLEIGWVSWDAHMHMEKAFMIWEEPGEEREECAGVRTSIFMSIIALGLRMLEADLCKSPGL